MHVIQLCLNCRCLDLCAIISIKAKWMRKCHQSDLLGCSTAPSHWLINNSIRCRPTEKSDLFVASCSWKSWHIQAGLQHDCTPVLVTLESPYACPHMAQAEAEGISLPANAPEPSPSCKQMYLSWGSGPGQEKQFLVLHKLQWILQKAAFMHMHTQNTSLTSVWFF